MVSREKTKILIICTGNTCRSQMTEGFLKSFDKRLEVYSAGTSAEGEINKYAVKVMKEVGIDISGQKPEPVDNYLNDELDYVITVCDGAREVCPIFAGKVKKRLHIGFKDPAAARGTDEEVMPVYRKVRDEIATEFKSFYENELKPKLK